MPDTSSLREIIERHTEATEQSETALKLLASGVACLQRVIATIQSGAEADLRSELTSGISRIEAAKALLSADSTFSARTVRNFVVSELSLANELLEALAAGG